MGNNIECERYDVMLDIIDYGRKLIWCTENIPTVYSVILFEEDGRYFLRAYLEKGTSILNFTKEEKEKFQKILDLENKQLDFEHVEVEKYHDKRLRFKISVN